MRNCPTLIFFWRGGEDGVGWHPALTSCSIDSQYSNPHEFVHSSVVDINPNVYSEERLHLLCCLSKLCCLELA